MHRSLFHLRLPVGLASLLLLLVTLFLSACQKEEVDNTDYKNRDKETIEAYIKDNNLTGFQRQSSGLFVAITQPGTGDLPKTGQTISAKYTGYTLDGKVFDSTASNGNTPLDFPLGRGKVITGWDEGFALLNKGSKAILLIPSGLAYGPQGVGPIAPHSVLRFDVEVTDIK